MKLCRKITITDLIWQLLKMGSKGKALKDAPSAVRGGDFKFDPEVYKEVSCSASLQEIRLIASKFSVKSELFLTDDDVGTPKSLFTGGTSDVLIDDEEGLIAGKYNWEAEIKFGRKTGLKLQTTHMLIYSGVAGLDPNHINHYFNKIGRFSTYPYFRSIFSTHVSDAGLMLPPLPSLNERVD